MKHQPYSDRRQMHGTTYEIFHYRETRGRDVEVHHHDFYEVYLLLDGEVDYWVDGEICRLEAGDLLLIHPQQLHRPLPGNAEIYERIVLWIDRDYLAMLSDEDIDLCRCFDMNAPGHRMHIRASDAQKHAVAARLGELVRERHSDSVGSTLLANGIFLQFMVELNRLAYHLAQAGGPLENTGSESRATENSALISRVLAYIGAHCHEELSLDSIADYFFVSKYHLSHAFSREVGVSVYRYITIRRLMLARQLLARGIPAGDVCYHSGFRDYAGFYRAFKAEYGASPRAFADNAQQIKQDSSGKEPL
ncbi:MAG: helix-turn-helix domain-containing protein [Clostridia bacterium]|nr:helix-turn-helix domain-containing protein [Clostridia bacterium]